MNSGQWRVLVLLIVLLALEIVINPSVSAFVKERVAVVKSVSS